jgi:3-oxoacyl-[acyl-carrier protein] reductase
MSERIAIVTGGSTGIGSAICRQLLAADYSVICMSRRASAIKSPRLHSVLVDLADPAATRQAAAEVSKQYAVTHIVHNAGAARERALEAVTVEDMTALTHLHLVAPILLLQANLATMKAAHHGRVILISSRAILGLAKRTAYASTKAGMLGLARTWALELAPFGITVNVVAPGPIEETEMFDELAPRSADKRAALANSIPVRRLGRPDDVAAATLYFLSESASFVTGQTLYVCGGTSVGSLRH